MLIGEKIKQIREKKNFSQESLEILTTKPKIKQSTLSRFESSERIPKQNQLEELARALDISVEELTDNADMTTTNKPIKKVSKIKICVNPHCAGLGKFETSNIALVGSAAVVKNTKDKQFTPTKLITFNSVLADSNDNFCGYCGGELISECAICEGPIKDTEKAFCSNCGYQFFYLCGHNKWNSEIIEYNSQLSDEHVDEGIEEYSEEIPPYVLNIIVNGDENEQLLPSTSLNLDLFNPARGHFSTWLISQKIDLSLVEEVETPDWIKDRYDSKEIKMVKYLSGDDQHPFPALIYEHDKNNYYRYLQRFDAECDLCGTCVYDKDKKNFKCDYDYDFGPV